MFIGILLLQVFIVCCFYFLYCLGGSGNWSTSGCNTVMDANYSVRCYCDHLTNFACLVVRLFIKIKVSTLLNAKDISARAQGATQAPYYVTFIFEVVTYVGVCLSLVGLVLTIITLSIFKWVYMQNNQKSKSFLDNLEKKMLASFTFNSACHCV